MTDYKYGLDVSGGVRFTMQMDTSKLPASESIAQVRERMLHILTNRAGGLLGVTEPSVQSKGEDQFIIELPGETNVERARQTLSTTASIKLYHALNVVTDSKTFRRYEPNNEVSRSEPVVTFHDKTLNKDIKPGDPEYLDMIKEWKLILEGDDLARADFQPGPGNGYQPTMTFSSDGARKLREWTTQFKNTGEMIAFVLDNRVLSINRVENNTVLSDHAFINGSFSGEYVRQLRDLLNAGALPVDLHELSVQTVDPTIGKGALHVMVMAGIASFAIIGVYLIAYYMMPGFIALVALILYTLFTLTALKLINATFSLAAIAGFILSVGMAVDANILVFERVKEELRSGRSLLAAVELGFKRALPAIVDSNACTILTSLVLANLGTGPVKGFAITLIIGVAISLFTAVTVTRSLLLLIMGSGSLKPESFGLKRQWFGKFESGTTHEGEPLHIVSKAGKWFLISGITVLVTLPFFFIGGFKPSVEFMGGYEAQFKVGNDVNGGQILGNLERNGINGGNVKFSVGGGTRIASVTVPATPKIGTGPDAPNKVAEFAGLPPESRIDYTYVGPTVQAETIKNAALGVAISIMLIVVYLAFRFGVALGGFIPGLRFGFSAVGALVHDILVVIGLAAVMGYFMGWEVSALFLTAMLTIIGFSVHDTIVIFDRIRENLRKPLRGETFEHLINRSVTQSFARSINTSLTVLVTLGILFLFGTTTPELKLFVFAMFVGILSGTYSSIYNAAPILYLWDKLVEKNKGHEATFMGMAAHEAARLRAAQLTVATASEERTVKDSSGRTYGQIKRRSGVAEKRGEQEIED
jgi:SecD/SecF fusion protein